MAFREIMLQQWICVARWMAAAVWSKPLKQQQVNLKLLRGGVRRVVVVG
jgi:hypothetical protein